MAFPPLAGTPPCPKADGGSVRALAAVLVPGALPDQDLLRTEDAAYGLRWLEITCGRELDPRRSLVRDLPSPLLDRGVEKPTRPPRLWAARRDR